VYRSANHLDVALSRWYSAEDSRSLMNQPEASKKHSVAASFVQGIMEKDAETQEKPESSILTDERPMVVLDECAHLFTDDRNLLRHDWKSIRNSLPDEWKWDLEYQITSPNASGPSGCWTLTPLDSFGTTSYPLTIAGAPVVLPVGCPWPPTSGVSPPPDPRSTALIDCCAELSLEVVKDIFLTFEGSVGFYVLINGLLQIIVPREFDMDWAASHLPHKYGGLKVCYIEQNLEPTVLPSLTETEQASASSVPPVPAESRISQSTHRSIQYPAPNPLIQLNDFIEARPLGKRRKEKYSGRIGLKVAKGGVPFIAMSTHVITKAILAKSHRDALFGRDRLDRLERLQSDWNTHTKIRAGNKTVSTTHTTNIVMHHAHSFLMRSCTNESVRLERSRKHSMWMQGSIRLASVMMSRSSNRRPLPW